MGKSKPYYYIALLASWLLLANCAVNTATPTLEEWVEQKYVYLVSYNSAYAADDNLEPDVITGIAMVGAPLTDDDVGELAQLEPKLYDISFSGRSNLTDASAYHLSTISTLRSIDLTDLQITDEGIAAFANLPNLKNLNISKTKVTDAGVAKLKDLENLSQLALSFTDIKGFGFEGFHALERLHISGTQLEDSALELIAKLPQLTYLSLANSSITDQGIARLSAAGTNSHPLDLNIDNTKITDRGIHALLPLAQRLTSLSLIDTAVTDASVDTLVKMRNLEHVYIFGTEITQVGYKRLVKTFPKAFINWSRSNSKPPNKS